MAEKGVDDLLARLREQGYDWSIGGVASSPYVWVYVKRKGERTIGAMGFTVLDALETVVKSQ